MPRSRARAPWHRTTLRGGDREREEPFGARYAVRSVARRATSSSATRRRGRRRTRRTPRPGGSPTSPLAAGTQVAADREGRRLTRANHAANLRCAPQRLAEHWVKLTDVPECKRAQERPERRRRHRPVPEDRLGVPGAQHVAVIDAVRAQQCIWGRDNPADRAVAGDHRAPQAGRGPHTEPDLSTFRPPSQRREAETLSWCTLAHGAFVRSFTRRSRHRTTTAIGPG
jgi:hypothetical protein